MNGHTGFLVDSPPPGRRCDGATSYPTAVSGRLRAGLHRARVRAEHDPADARCTD